MPEVEFDAVVVRPFEAVHAEIVSTQGRPRRPLGVGVGDGEHQERSVAEEDEPAARAEQAGGLRNPDVWIAPDRGAVLADRKVEAGVRQRHRFGVAVDEGKVQVVLVLQHPCRGKLCFGHVDTDDASTPTGQPRRDVSGAASQLDDVEAIHVGEDVHLAVRRYARRPSTARTAHARLPAST